MYVLGGSQMVFGRQGLARSMAGAIGAAAGLITVAPLLIPVALVAPIPGLGGERPAGRETVSAGQESGPFGLISAGKMSFSYPGSERAALVGANGSGGGAGGGGAGREG